MTRWHPWRWLLPFALACPAGAGAVEPPENPEEPVYTSVRSRLYLRLDPSAVPDPDGRVRAAALGNVRLMARGEVDAEAAGWIGHSPGAASYAADDLSGTLTSLLFTNGWGPVKLTVGRQWTRVGSQRLTGMDGVTMVARLLDGDVEVAARTGLSGLEPKDAFGDVPEIGGHVALVAADDLRLEVGVLHQQPAEVRQRTRWTAGADWQSPTLDLNVHSFATMDIESQALVDARLESFWRPHDDFWLRGYGRLTRVDLLLAPDEVLAVFAQDNRGELGVLGEYMLNPKARLRLDMAAIYSRDRVGAGRYRTVLDINPVAGSLVLAEATILVDRIGYSGTGRVAGRTALIGTWFTTLETLGDLDVEGRPAAYARWGTGYEPWHGWFCYGAVEVAYAHRWPDGRLAGLMMLEHALGAPVRWGAE